MADIHTSDCRNPMMPHSDEAKRLSDEYRLHRLADPIGSIGKFFAAKIQDCTSDHTLYDTWDDAVEHHMSPDPAYWMYVQVVPADMPVCQAETFLKIQRIYFEKGINRPQDKRKPIPRLLTEDMNAQMRTITRGTPPRNLVWPHHGKAR